MNTMLDTLDTFGLPALAALANGLWQSLLLAGLAWALLQLPAVREGLNAATRYVLLLVLLLSVVTLPVLTFVQAVPERAASIPALAAPTAAPVAEMPAARAVDVPPRPDVAPIAVPALPPAGIAPAAAGSAPLVTWSPSTGWIRLLVGLWALGVLLLSARLVEGIRRLQTLKAASRPLPARYHAALLRWQRASGARRPVHAAASAGITSPLAAGLVAPTILIPAHFVEQLSDDEIEQVLLHELAHLQRWDDWTRLFQKLSQAIFFLFPAVHWIGREMDHAREVACDDWVVAHTRAPRAYASCLARLVELGMQAQRGQVAPGMAAGADELFGRVRALLDRQRRCSPHVSKRAGTAALGLLALSLGALLSLPVIGLARPATPPSPSPPAPPPLSAAAPPPEASAVRNTPLRPSTASSGAVSAPEHATRLLPDRTGSRTASSPATPDDGLSKASLIKTLRAAASIPSSDDRAGVLVRAAARLPADADVWIAYLETARTIPSNADRARTLTALLAHHDPAEQVAVRFLEVARGMTSSSEKARILIAAADRLSGSAPVRTAYLDAARSITSAADQTRAVSAWLNAHRD